MFAEWECPAMSSPRPRGRSPPHQVSVHFTVARGACKGEGMPTDGRPWAFPHLCKPPRSEEHTSELQSQSNLVCRLLLDKKKRSAELPPRDVPALRPLAPGPDALPPFLAHPALGSAVPAPRPRSSVDVLRDAGPAPPDRR